MSPCTLAISTSSDMWQVDDNKGHDVTDEGEGNGGYGE